MKLYIAKDNQQLGPFRPSVIRDQLRSGMLSADQLAWHKGLKEWRPLREIFPAEVAQAPLPSPPAAVGATTSPTAVAAPSPAPVSAPSASVQAQAAPPVRRRMPLWGKILVAIGGLFALLGVLVIVVIVIATHGDKANDHGDKASANPALNTAEKAVSQFHQQLDQSDFKGIYEAADPEFKKATTEKDFIALLEAVHTKLGLVQSSAKNNVTSIKSSLETKETLSYKTKFAQGDAVEVFSYRIEDDKGLLLGYDISSSAISGKISLNISVSDSESPDSLRAAAEKGNATAQTHLGVMYAEGSGGVTKDDAEALKWFRKAAEQGDADSESNLGVFYQFERGGLPKDEAEAVKWYRKSAEQGNSAGEYHLGGMYESALGGLAKDEAQAAKWYRKAAEQGHSDGQNDLGNFYKNGQGGLAQDDAEAVKWYRKSAEQGNAAGQYNLGFMYEQGRGGLPKDIDQALTLYRKAAEQGLSAAKEKLNTLEHGR